MAKIKVDERGLYAKAGGWIARPVKPTAFKEGDVVAATHFSGSPIVGMGKLPGRGKYQEYWRTWEGNNLEYGPRGNIIRC